MTTDAIPSVGNEARSEIDKIPRDSRSVRLGFIPNPHLDLFWLGSYLTCLERGANLLHEYLEECISDDRSTLLIDSVIFAQALVERYPDSLDELRGLTREGRVQIGAAYIDRWENLVLGESHIRNYLLGKRWCSETLGYEADLACHPDIPGMVTQMAQICAGVGIRHYVTARKVFREGRVWRLRSPDGSLLLVLQWPGHYMFEELTDGFDDTDLESRYPAGVVLFSGGAGDLASPADFRALHGRDLPEFLAAYGSRFPDVEVGYDTPGRVLAAYDPASADDGLAEVDLPIPSVWGVMPDEEMVVFRSIREVERRLLEAETAAVCATAMGAPALPRSARDWQGMYYERAFYRRNDVPPEGRELDELWRMHLFTQDHNGGEEGALSSFQKRVRQDRCVEACDEIISHAIESARSSLRPADLYAFNSTLQPWSGVISLDVASSAGRVLTSMVGANCEVQRSSSAIGKPRINARLDHIAPVGFTALMRDDLAREDSFSPVAVTATPETIELCSPWLQVLVDKRTGEASMLDATDGRLLQDGLGRLDAVKETGNDVTLLTDEQSRETARTTAVEIASTGPLFAEAVVRRRLHDTEWTTLIRVHTSENRVDVETAVRWWGSADVQVRMRLGSAPDASSIAYGTPFHGSPWDAVPELAGPLLDDEIRPDDYRRYREIQHWLHLDNGARGLTVTTQHPAVRFDAADGIEAVLLRTPASCGDPRFYWANAGEQEWSFSYRPGPRSWQDAHAPLLGDSDWRVPHLSAAVEGSGGEEPESDEHARPGRLSMLAVDESAASRVILTSLAPVARGGASLARILDPSATPARATLSGVLTSAGGNVADMHGALLRRVPVTPSGLELSIDPWQLLTLSLGPTVASERTDEGDGDD